MKHRRRWFVPNPRDRAQFAQSNGSSQTCQKVNDPHNADRAHGGLPALEAGVGRFDSCVRDPLNRTGRTRNSGLITRRFLVRIQAPRLLTGSSSIGRASRDKCPVHSSDNSRAPHAERNHGGCSHLAMRAGCGPAQAGSIPVTHPKRNVDKIRRAHESLRAKAATLHPTSVAAR